MTATQFLDPYEELGPVLADPVQFSRGMFNANLWEAQEEILYSVRDNPRTIVKACQSSSKTFTASLAALWWYTWYPKGIVVTTGPSWTQVETLLWGEIHSRLDESEIAYPIASTTKLVDPRDRRHYIRGMSTDRGVRFRGWHGDILVIIDEATGVDSGIYDEVEGMMAGGNVHLLALGNPTISSGTFFNAFHSLRAQWNPITISAARTPNIRPMLQGRDPESVTTEELADRMIWMGKHHPEVIAFDNFNPEITKRSWVLEKAQTWADYDLQLWNPRVMGIFPEHSQDQLIWLDWIEKARARDCRRDDSEDAPMIRAGVDPAGEGENDTGLALSQESRIIHLEGIPDSDPRGAVVERLRPFHAAGRLESVNVDVIGEGRLMYMHLKDLGFPVNAVNVARHPQGRTRKEEKANRERFTNYKAQLCWQFRELAKTPEFALAMPRSGKLRERVISQFTSVRWDTDNPRSLIQMESKKKAAARGVPSPDYFDAAVLCFAKPAHHGVPESEIRKY